MALVEDQRAVEQFAAAGLDPALHDRVHAGHLDATLDDLGAFCCEDCVEGGWVYVAVADEVLHGGVGVLEVHDRVSGELGDPAGAENFIHGL